LAELSATQSRDAARSDVRRAVHSSIVEAPGQTMH
jgi:hypothetical protein